MTDRFTLHHGDCIEVMRTMPDNSVDSIVTDPPYELTGKSGRGGFMGKEWDATGIAFNPEMWREALRVLKPGGHLLAFSGSRTYHRMAVAIEDAGFEIRDQIMWIYGSGFPKSLDVSKAIDKAAGAVREVVGTRITGAAMTTKTSDASATNFGSGQNEIAVTAPATPQAQQWAGWGTALKPAHEPIVVARKPLTGTVAANVLAHGVGALNIDGCRVGSEATSRTNIASSSFMTGDIGSEQPTREEYTTGSTQGRWPANVIHDGSDEVVALFPTTKSGDLKPYTMDKSGTTVDFKAGVAERTMTRDGDSGSAAQFFYCAKANKRDRNEGLDGFEAKPKQQVWGETFAAGRNPETGERTEAFSTISKNHHPTVKPTDLMRYLIRLVTPLGATILDPFMGSGSTGKAAMYEGVNFIGIEQDAEYLAIAKARIEFALNKPAEDVLFERTTPSDKELADQLALPLNKEETA